jgi:hypothetical protein
MKRTKTISIAVAVAAISFGAMLFAEEDARFEEFFEVRGVFVRLIERQVGEKEYLGIVVKPFESDDHVIILTPREQENLVSVARRLKEGQKVEIGYVRSDGQNWLRRLSAEWQQGDPRERKVERISVGMRRSEDQPRREVRVIERREATRTRAREGQSGDGIATQIEQIAKQFREIVAQASQMEREMRALRAENEGLRRIIGELRSRGQDSQRREGDRPQADRRRGEREPQARTNAEPRMRRVREGERDREPRPALPDSLAGFQGVLTGEIVRKMDRGFMLRAHRVNQVWKNNKAENPDAAIGKVLLVVIRAEQEGGERFMRTLRELRVGQKVQVEAFHFEGEHLTVVEQLRIVD